MKLPRLEGMPLFIQEMLENEPKKVVYVTPKKRFSISRFFLKLIVGILMVVVGLFIFLNFLPDILKIGGFGF